MHFLAPVKDFPCLIFRQGGDSLLGLFFGQRRERIVDGGFSTADFGGRQPEGTRIFEICAN